MTLNLVAKSRYVQVRGGFPSLRPTAACGTDPPATRLPPNLIPPTVVGLAIAERLAHMFPPRLTYFMEWNLTSGGERLGPWLQLEGKDTSTTRTLAHNSRNSEVTYPLCLAAGCRVILPF